MTTEPTAADLMNAAIRRGAGRELDVGPEPASPEDTSIDQGVRTDPPPIELDPLTAYRRATRGH